MRSKRGRLLDVQREEEGKTIFKRGELEGKAWTRGGHFGSGRREKG